MVESFIYFLTYDSGKEKKETMTSQPRRE